MREGLDYAFSKPSVTALVDRGTTFVCRYLSHSPSKNLTASEARTLTAAGIWIVVVWETTAKRALAGRSAGYNDAIEARAQARACGMPAGRPIYFAVDWDATASQQVAIDAYLDGAAAVLGRDNVGIYGGYGPVSRALAAGKAKWAWQTYAWSGGKWAAGAQIQQYSNGHAIDGADCDYDRATTSDYGQWRVGVSPSAQEDEMATVSSLGVDGKQVIKAGATADVKFTTEYTDKHGLHGENGLSVVIAGASYWVIPSAIFQLDGLTPGAKIDVAWTRVKDDGAFFDDAWRLTFTADDSGTVRDELGGQFGVDDTNRLRLRVYNTGDKDVTVQGCMAKASLFKF